MEEITFTNYQSKFFAHELTKRCPPDSVEKLAGAVASAQVDLNPHQVDAALFAFQSPLSKGALLADEVGLGLGIYSMILAQRERYFPLPDYTKSTLDQVVLEIFGHLIDENYTKLLLERQDLTLETVILLDRIQKKQSITEEAAAKLRRECLIEGRRPHYFVSAKIAAVTGAGAAYTRSRGLDKKKLKEFVLQHLRDLGPTSRARLEELLFEMLPADLTSVKKQNKVKNLLSEMRAKDHSIRSSGQGTDYKWKLTES